MRACMCSHVWLFATPWTVAHQASFVHGIFQARILEWVAIYYSNKGIGLEYNQISLSSIFYIQLLC